MGRKMKPISTITATGTTFSMFPPNNDGPAPTLLLLAAAGIDTILNESYCRVGQLLHALGWTILSLDLPCHGDDHRLGEPEELDGWASRVAAGENIITTFQHRVNDVLNHLIATGITDTAHIATVGISRGAFMAFHAAAGNAQIRAVAGLSPVTDLRALKEFAGQESNPLVQRLALLNTAVALSDRAVWITIGNADERVGTANAVAFARALANTKPKSNPLAGNVELHVLPTPGHYSFPEWHDDASIWLQKVTTSMV